ncbi:hypothetical protein Emag_002725 [Eimeria magna]
MAERDGRGSNNDSTTSRTLLFDVKRLRAMETEEERIEVEKISKEKPKTPDEKRQGVRLADNWGQVLLLLSAARAADRLNVLKPPADGVARHWAY